MSLKKYGIMKDKNKNNDNKNYFVENEKKNNLSKALKENISKRKQQTKLRLKVKK